MYTLLRRALQCLGFIVLCNAVGLASALIGSEPAFYERIPKPGWAPPPSVFGPVWTGLYILMGIATWIVWSRSRGEVRRRAMTVFAVQLALNALWSPVFFGLHAIAASIVVIALVFVAVLALIATYARTSRVAASLVAPIAAWVLFATVLDIAIWKPQA